MQKLLGLFAVLILFALPARAQDSTTQEAQKEPEKKQETPKEEAKPEEAPEKQKPQRITPKYELEGGYTYRSFYPPNAPRFGMNGWNATFDYNWKHWISLIADGTGTSGAPAGRTSCGLKNALVCISLSGGCLAKIIPTLERSLTSLPLVV